MGLERDGTKIACEICITCPHRHELANTKKCLATGYNKVILCSPEKKVINKVKKLTSKKLKDHQQHKVLFFLPKESTSYLKEQAARAATTEAFVASRRVRTIRKPVYRRKGKKACVNRCSRSFSDLSDNQRVKSKEVSLSARAHQNLQSGSNYGQFRFCLRNTAGLFNSFFRGWRLLFSQERRVHRLIPR